MKFELNKAITFQLVEEIGLAISHSGKSRDEIFNTLVLQHPEITYSKEDWENFSRETKDSIINRIKRTLIAM